jgi:hypothetical protein
MESTVYLYHNSFFHNLRFISKKCEKRDKVKFQKFLYTSSDLPQPSKKNRIKGIFDAEFNAVDRFFPSAFNGPQSRIVFEKMWEKAHF